MTFAELAESRGISKASAIKLIRRHGWRRQRDNRGHVRALVPLPWMIGEGEREPDSTPHTEPDNLRDREAYKPPDTGALDAALAAANARAERAEKQADEANKRADVAVALAERTLAQLAETAAAIEALRGELREKDAEVAGLRAAADVAGIRMQQAQEAAEALRRDLEAAQIAQAEAEADAAELRQANADRRGQGRWARLRAAWRGE